MLLNKKALLFIVSVVFAISGIAQNCLVASYPFCENANDHSGNGLNGIVTNATLAKNRDGLSNNAYYFDGNGDYIRIPNDSLIDFQFNQDFSIVFWVKLPVNQNHTPNQANDLIDMWLDATSGQRRYPYSLRIFNQTSSSPGTLRLTRKDDPSCDNYMEMNPDTAVNDTLWHMIAVVKENDTLRSYVDAIAYDTIQDSSICNTTNGYDLTFGRRDGTKNPNWLTGYLDDINLYNCALTLSDIQNLYCSNYTSEDISICYGDSIFIDTAYRSEPGEYLQFLNNSNGCDSIVCIHLSVDDEITGSDVDTICSGDSILIGGIYRNVPGIYPEIYTASNGCDSVVDINLGLRVVNTSISILGTQLFSPVTNALYQWIRCDLNNQPINGATGSFYNATESGQYALVLLQNGCIDTSDCYEIIIQGIKDEISEFDIKIFPNPANDIVNITFPQNKTIRIKIFNMEGREISLNIERKLNLITIDLNEFESGNYLILAEINGKKITRNLVVE